MGGTLARLVAVPGWPAGGLPARALALLATPRGRALYRQRTIIEQVNGQLKDVLRLSDIPYYVRGDAGGPRGLATWRPQGCR
jgi:hypothetical protein